MRTSMSDREQRTSILKHLLRNFDIAIQIISEDMGVEILPEIASCLLEKFLRVGGDRYIALTYMNIPWILAYMSNIEILPGMCIHDEQLKVSLSKIPNIFFDEKNCLVYNDRPFPNLYFEFSDHVMRRREWKESIKLLVYLEEGDSKARIFHKKIQICPMRFQEAISDCSDKNRGPELMALGKAVLRLIEYVDRSL